MAEARSFRGANGAAGSEDAEDFCRMSPALNRDCLGRLIVSLRTSFDTEASL